MASWTPSAFKYVSSSASGGGAGTIGDPYTLAEGITNATAGVVMVVIGDGAYSITSPNTTNDGTMASGATAPIVWVGAVSGSEPTTLAEIQLPERPSPGQPLDMTGYPVITVSTTAWLADGDHTYFMGIYFKGDIASDAIFELTSLAYSAQIIRCKVEQLNTGTTNSTAACSMATTAQTAVDCDLINYANNNYTVTANAAAYTGSSVTNGYVMCRCESRATTANKGIAANLRNPVSTGCFYSALNGVELSMNSAHFVSVGETYAGRDNTKAYAAVGTGYNASLACWFIGCHITDHANTVYKQYSFFPVVFMMDCRVRDQTAFVNATGPEEFRISNYVDTDTGGESTDFVNASAGNFDLLSSAPGYGAMSDGVTIGIRSVPGSGSASGSPAIFQVYKGRSRLRRR